MFSVSPSITPVAVIILAGNMIGILGCCRFSTLDAMVLVPRELANYPRYMQSGDQEEGLNLFIYEKDQNVLFGQ
jgi:hypothetical protein